MKDFRGVKRDVWQGSHTVPFIVSYPAKIKKGLVSNCLVSQTDITATLADYLNIEFDHNDAEDSYSFLDEIIEGNKVVNKREMAIHQSAWGMLAIRQGDWVFINDDHGNGNEEPEWYREKLGVVPHQEEFELFNIKQDQQQTRNVIREFPDKAEELKKLLKKFIDEGRTVVR